MDDMPENSYQKVWTSLFCKQNYLEQLRSSAAKGSLKNSPFRSVCWKIFLECLPEDRNLWIDSTKLKRQYYEEILDKCRTNPRTSIDSMDVNVNNPLSQSQQSPWNQYFQDSELKITIQQDVVRTFPEIEFFRSPKIQKMMISILFSYAREHPHASYKQGMHELLAPIIYVLHCDQQIYLHASKSQDLELDIHILLNQNYMEHDAFFLFCHLMEAVKDWYSLNESPYSKCATQISGEPFSQSIVFEASNSLAIKLKRIYELLRHHDEELFMFLEQMEIIPQIYGIRWLRLLFGREFALHDLLIVWDAIFADSITFCLVDYIFVAMLIAIRDSVLQSDYASCLSYLMHYPKVDVHYIINLALFLRNPKDKIKPEKFSNNPLHVKTKSSPNKNLSRSMNLRHSAVVNASCPISNKHFETRPKTLNIASISIPSPAVSVLESATVVEADNHLKSSYLHKREYFSVSENQLECHDSSISRHEGTLQTNERKNQSFPFTNIQNVMEEGSHKCNASVFSQVLRHPDDKKNVSSVSDYREMVPIFPVSRIPINSAEEVKMLKTELSELKFMNEICVQQMTQHLEKLQESMVNQSLQHEDEILLAIAGLKRVRDILRGTVNFEELVADNDSNPYCALSNMHNLSSELIVCNQVKVKNLDFVPCRKWNKGISDVTSVSSENEQIRTDLEKTD
ncbi:TBC1 domain family member 5-like isoform X3 [Stegodyphus dumicola]|uniref:TBC1 domain family member 5-like isoform X3 n=1 Tax=Stegodyphus dumicola TaxID=202533 RepID=UPI0015A8D5A0|nr:TBC1 domain family member 5-like isoform X3 [Stegodyphus dumicola]